MTNTLTELELRAALSKVSPANVETLQRIADGLRALNANNSGGAR